MILSILVLIILTIISVEIFIRTDFIGSAKSVISHQKAGMSAILSKELTDDQKEAASKKASIRVLKTTCISLFKLALAIGFVLGGAALFNLAVRGGVKIDVLGVTELVVMTIASIIYFWGRSQVVKSPTT